MSGEMREQDKDEKKAWEEKDQEKIYQRKFDTSIAKYSVVQEGKPGISLPVFLGLN